MFMNKYVDFAGFANELKSRGVRIHVEDLCSEGVLPLNQALWGRVRLGFMSQAVFLAAPTSDRFFCKDGEFWLKDALDTHFSGGYGDEFSGMRRVGRLFACRFVLSNSPDDGEDRGISLEVEPRYNFRPPLTSIPDGPMPTPVGGLSGYVVSFTPMTGGGDFCCPPCFFSRTYPLLLACEDYGRVLALPESLRKSSTLALSSKWQSYSSEGWLKRVKMGVCAGGFFRQLLGFFN